jgi:hypothetical protein
MKYVDTIIKCLANLLGIIMIINLTQEKNIVTRTTAPVYLSGIENNTLRGHLVSDASVTSTEELEILQFDDNITVSSGKNTIRSLYVMNLIKQQKSKQFIMRLKNISRTLSCKGIFSKFNNGTAIFEYDNETGKRCLTLYEKN